MLMTMGREDLTDLERLIVGKIRGAGDWITRKDIAGAIGRGAQLNAYDIRTLERLTEAGYIEAQQITVKAAQKIWQYRVKPDQE